MKLLENIVALVVTFFVLMVSVVGFIVMVMGVAIFAAAIAIAVTAPLWLPVLIIIKLIGG